MNPKNFLNKLKSLIDKYRSIRFLMNFYFLWNLVFLLSCHKYKEGNCIQASNGYVWKIIRIQDNKYSVMGFLKNSWGNEVLLDFEILDKNHIEINCPVININN